VKLTGVESQSVIDQTTCEPIYNIDGQKDGNDDDDDDDDDDVHCVSEKNVESNFLR